MGLDATDPIRLLYLQPAEGFGGAERQGVLHISKLVDHGFDVTPVVGPGQPIRRALDDLGVDDFVFLTHLSHEADYPLSSIPAKLRFADGFFRDWLTTQRSLYRLAVARRIQVIVANRSTGWIAASLVARRLGIPIVWRGGSRITSDGEATALRLFSRILPPTLLLANCEAVRNDLAPLVGVPSQILRNGVDVERFDPVRTAPRFRQQLGIADDVPVVGFPSRPAPEKGLELLARVAERTARALPKVRFLVAGEFGWRRHFEGMMAARGLGHRVQFLGHVPEIEAFHRSCDAIVLTSKAHSIEGSPNTLLEAMAMERPVVATRVGGVSEAVSDGVEGFLVEDEDEAGFSARLVTLLSDRDARRKMGRAGRATIVEKFHHEKVVATLADLIHALVSDGAPTHTRHDWERRGRVANAA